MPATAHAVAQAAASDAPAAAWEAAAAAPVAAPAAPAAGGSVVSLNPGDRLVGFQGLALVKPSHGDVGADDHHYSSFGWFSAIFF